MITRLAKSLVSSPSAGRFAERLEKALPPLRAWHRAQYERHFHKFYKWERLFSGVYPDFATALQHIPADRPIGYDNPEAATFLGRQDALLPCEYPVLFWLSRLLHDNPAIFDFGGYLGLLYNAYKRFDLYPANLHWTIYDVPAVVAAGEKILTTEPDPRLSFTSSLADAASADIFLASGSIHFCEESLPSMLSRLSALPRHLLINKLPATAGSQFVTLHNMGPAIAPYKIVNRTDFLNSLQSLGYTLIDSWKNPELTCYIPFHPDQVVESFDGFYLRHESR